MNNISSIKPKDLLPHQDKMCIIDKIIEASNDIIICQSYVSKDNIFYNTKIKGIYNWFGIEFMAQTVGIFAGYHTQGSDKPDIGLLLSVREFKSSYHQFDQNKTLTIIAKKIFLEGNIGVFNCKINIDGEKVCQAKLNTYLPKREDVQAILTGKALS